MARRHISRALAVGVALAVSSCGGGETTEGCIQRFGEMVIGGQRLDSPAHGDTRYLPVFTYDITRMEDALEQLAGTPEQREGLRMTVAGGDSGPALDAFYRDQVPPKGALLTADGASFYRLRGASGTRRETIAAGCREAPAKARLIRIDWTPMAPA